MRRRRLRNYVLLAGQGWREAERRGMGLSPGAEGGGWLQKVPLVGIATRMPPAVTFVSAPAPDRSIQCPCR